MPVYLTDLVYHLRDIAEWCFLWDIEILATLMKIPGLRDFIADRKGVLVALWVGEFPDS